MSQELKPLAVHVVALARMVAKQIMSVYLSNDVTFLHLKDNATPLSSADILANQLITQELQTITPDIPILSEEMEAPAYAIRQQWQYYWLIDPLDGTRGFLDKTGDFSINIALMARVPSKILSFDTNVSPFEKGIFTPPLKNGADTQYRGDFCGEISENEEYIPILGVVAIPTKDLCYCAIHGDGAWKYTGQSSVQPIHTRSAVPPLTVLISAHHQSPNIKELAAKLMIKEFIPMGSAYKICLLAEGSADLYPRFAPTMEWDLAAAHCVLREAGGDILTLSGTHLQYNTKGDLQNPNFIAVGDCEFARQQIFSRHVL